MRNMIGRFQMKTDADPENPQEDGKPGRSDWFARQPAKARLDGRDVEVDEERSVELRQFQVGDHLRLVDREKLFDRLDLENDPTIDDEIDAVTAVEDQAFVFQDEWALVLEGEPAKRELATQTRLVGGLEESRAEVTVDFDAGADDLWPSPGLVDTHLCAPLFVLSGGHVVQR